MGAHIFFSILARQFVSSIELEQSSSPLIMYWFVTDAALTWFVIWMGNCHMVDDSLCRNFCFDIFSQFYSPEPKSFPLPRRITSRTTPTHQRTSIIQVPLVTLEKTVSFFIKFNLNPIAPTSCPSIYLPTFCAINSGCRTIITHQRTSIAQIPLVTLEKTVSFLIKFNFNPIAPTSCPSIYLPTFCAINAGHCTWSRC